MDQHVHQLGTATAAARQEAAERTIEVTKLETAAGQLRSEVERHVQRARTLEEEKLKASAPTFTTLGERIGSILTLADQEANEMRTRAQADAANHHALADESALATRPDADHYSTQMRSAAEAEAARFMENAKRQADSILDDADREAVARRGEDEAVYERARAKAATAAVDFGTILAARRDASALEFAAEATAAEQQLTTIRLQSEQTRIETEQSQQEAASRSEQQLEQAMNQAHTLVAEAKSKAERIRGDSERELAAATQRRDSINAQLSNVRQMLAALGGVAAGNPVEPAAAAAGQPRLATAVAAPAEQHRAVSDVKGGKDVPATDKLRDDKAKGDSTNDRKAGSSRALGGKG